MSQKKSIRIKDIAERAGVSVSTVSNVLSGKRQKNSETGKRVLEIAGEMGYFTKNAGNSNQTIRFVVYKKNGLIVMDTPFFSELFSGIEHACSSHGYTLTFSFIDSAHDPDYRERLNSMLSDPATPILLLATEMSEEDIAPFRDFKGPLVVLDSLFLKENFNTVSIDNFAAGWQGADLLLDAGHTHLGLLAYSTEVNNVLHRSCGFRSALEARGLTLSEEDIVAVEPTLDGSCRDMQNWLNQRKSPLPTGFFAVNDITAVGAMRAMSLQGIRIPEDVSIVGMDNMSFSRITFPALTTLDVPKHQISQLAVERLIKMTEQPDGLCLKTVVSAFPISRGSTRNI